MLPLYEIRPLTKANRYEHPRNPGDPLPIVYGDLTVGAPKGVWHLPCIDTINYIYLIADHAILPAANGNTFEVFDKDGNLMSGYTVSTAWTDDDGNTISYLQFTTGDKAAYEPISIRCRGRHEGYELIRNPIDIAVDYLKTFCEATSADFNATALSVARAFATNRGYEAAGVVVDDKSPGEVLTEILSCFMATWWKDSNGKVVFQFTIRI